MYYSILPDTVKTWGIHEMLARASGLVSTPPALVMARPPNLVNVWEFLECAPA